MTTRNVQEYRTLGRGLWYRGLDKGKSYRFLSDIRKISNWEKNVQSRKLAVADPEQSQTSINNNSNSNSQENGENVIDPKEFGQKYKKL